jgi:hypothetical protein
MPTVTGAHGRALSVGSFSDIVGRPHGVRPMTHDCSWMVVSLASVVSLSAVSSAGCASLSPPFDTMKGGQMTVYRLQNFEAPQQAPAAAPSGLQLPPQIQQWIQAGASLLPPGLLPPGLVPGAASPASVAPDAPRFHGFRILEWQAVNDAGVKGDILATFGHSSSFNSAQSTCMYAELGFAIAQANNPTPADILVSLSCQDVQAYNFAWPYSQMGITPDAEKKFAQIEQRVFVGR